MTIIGEAFVEVLPVTTGFTSKLKADVERATRSATATSNAAFTSLARVGRAAILGITVAAAAGGYAAVKMASDFQSAAVHLVTDAGESARNLGMVSKGMLDISRATGTAAKDVVNGMYHIESAGYHGQIGLNILRVAAEGAKVGGADLDTVSKTLTGTMRSYYGENLTAAQSNKLATQTMNELVAITGSGDLRMQDLASSLGNVTPIAAAAGLSLAQVGGAIATMTAQNMSAQQATQDLANLIRNLQAPSQVSSKEMAQLGLNSNTVSKNLGRAGLTGTIAELVTAITAHMGPAGLVLFNAFNQSQGASADMRIELSKMSPEARKMAQALQAGTMTAGEWRKSIKNLPYDQHNLALGFAQTYTQSHRFNDLLKAGSPAAQTFNAAMEKMTGGATGLNVALMLSGRNSDAFNSNVRKVSEASQKAGAHVDNWGMIQKTFAQQVAVARATLDALLITIGTRLIPVVEHVARALMGAVGWLEKHSAAAKVLAGIIGGVLTAAISAYVAKEVEMVAKSPFGKLIIAVVKWAAAQLISVTESIALWLIYTGIVEASGVAMLLAGGVILLAVAAIAAGVYLIIRNWSTIKKFFEALWKDVVKYFHDAVRDVEMAWGKVVDFFTNLGHDISRAFSRVVDDVKGFFQGLENWFKKWWPLLLPIAMGLFFGPLGFVVGVVISEILQHWRGFVQGLTAIWHAIWVVAGPIWHLISDVIRVEVDIIRVYLGIVWGFISTALRIVWDGIRIYFQVWWTVVTGIFQVAWNILKMGLQDAWDYISAVVRIVWDGIKAYFTIWWAVVTAIVRVGWDLIKTIFNVALDLITGKWGKAWAQIKDFFSNTWGIIQSTAKTVWGAISGFFVSAWTTFEGTVKSIWGNITGAITGSWNSLTGVASRVWATVKGAFVAGINDVIRIINGFISALDVIPFVSIHKIGLLGPGPVPAATGGSSAAMVASKTRHFAAGGIGVPVGQGFWTGGEIAIAGEGNPAYPEAVIPTDPRYRANALHLTRQLLEVMGVRKLSLGSFLSSAFHKFVGGVMSPAVSAAEHVAMAAVDHLPFPANKLGDWAIKSLGDALKHLLTGKKPGPAGGAGGLAAPGAGAPANAVAALAQQMAAQLYGWTGAQWNALNAVEMREAGWNMTAQNPTSPAYGIAQGITGPSWYYGFPGGNPNTAAGQITAFLQYIAGRYGNPAGAWAHEQQFGWYEGGGWPWNPPVDPLRRPMGYQGGGWLGPPELFDYGGWIMPGAHMVLNMAGKPERVLPPGAGNTGGVYVAPGAIPVNITFAGSASSDPGDLAAIQGAVEAGITDAINRLSDLVDQHPLRSP